MSGFRDHFLDKYFAYRGRYVAAIREDAPARERLAIVAEVARLVFVTAGCALLAVISWTLTVAGFGRIGIEIRSVLFGAFALWTTWLGVRAFGGLLAGLKALRKV